LHPRLSGIQKISPDPALKPRVVLNSTRLQLTLKRLCYQLIENHDTFANTVLIGLQPRGVYVARRIHRNLLEITGNKKILLGELDATFHRDDFRRRENPLTPSATNIDFLIENKNVVLIDDVLYTGRTIRAGMDALMAFGRPNKVELLVLVDRRFSRHLPIDPDYTGKTVDSVASEKVKVSWKETDGKDEVILFTEKKPENTK
jgi:pyrimidine operon attenuation protein / uracil phosphoribosyltransferase